MENCGHKIVFFNLPKVILFGLIAPFINNRFVCNNIMSIMTCRPVSCNIAYITKMPLFLDVCAALCSPNNLFSVLLILLDACIG